MISDEVKTHHIRRDLCTNRPPYRQGRQLKAVKVYTVAQESRYLLIQGIPSVGAHQDLIKLFALYGTIEEYRFLDEYPCEDFTEVIWIKFKLISAARLAKRKLDDYSFFGGVLHVCYAPEYENVQDTREKLQDRRKAIAARLRKLELEEETKTAEAVVIPDTEDQKQPQKQPQKSAQANSLTSQKPTVTPEIDTGNSKTDVANLRYTRTPSWPHYFPPVQPPPPPLRCVLPHTDVSVPPPPLYPMPPPPPSQSQSYPSQSPDQMWGGDIQHSAEESKQKTEITKRKKSAPGSSERKAYRISTAKIQARSQPLGKVSKISRDSQEIVVKSDVVHKQPEKIDLSRVEIRKYDKTVKEKPKFVPRQLAKRSPALPTRKRAAPVEDPINSELRKTATILAKKPAGPKLPESVEERRVTLKISETGDKSLDKTVVAIRDKIKQFSGSSAEPKCKKKKENSTENEKT